MTTQEAPLAHAEAAPASVPPGGSQLSDPQVRALRVAVMVMSTLLVIGFIALLGRIIYLVARPAAQNAGQASVPDVRATLPAGAHIRNIALQGDRLAIHYETPAGSGIAVVELSSGRTLSRIQLVPEGAKP
jgi:hypothetical protein